MIACHATSLSFQNIDSTVFAWRSLLVSGIRCEIRMISSSVHLKYQPLTVAVWAASTQPLPVTPVDLRNNINLSLLLKHALHLDFFAQCIQYIIYKRITKDKNKIKFD